MRVQQACCVAGSASEVARKGGSRAMLLGGARTVGGVRARRRFAPSRELRQGSGGAKIGLLES